MSDWLRYLLVAILLLVGVIIVGYGRSRKRAGGISRTRDDDTQAEEAVTRRRMAASVLGWLVLAMVVVTTSAAGLLWFLGWPRFPKAGSFDVPQLLDLLKIALSVVAGFGGVVLLAVNYRRQRVAEDEHDLDVDRAQREVEQRFNERLSSAAEQLAHDSPAVRLTGVYALAGLADDWADKRQVCVDVLCGYLRLGRNSDKPGEIEVRKAVLRAIRERVVETAEPSWRALDFDFTGLVFDNADFAGLSFEGAVVFDSAEFRGDLTSFARTTFRGRLSCLDTRFAAKETSFTNVVFERAAVHFVGAEFAGEVLDFGDGELSGRTGGFYACRFRVQRANFDDFSISAGTLRFEKCDFADLELTLSGRSYEWSGGGGGWSRVSMSDVRMVRCRLDLSWSGDRHRVITIQNAVLDTVAISVDTSEDAGPQRLSTENVELRGGTALPPQYRRSSVP
ncbi:hypothetical protein [Amycolatopsis sp.]|uniref:hypothetical protein n=1 Tax=Amycolatopsis sp. TaxID=37632 RepID=UPI002D7EEF8D|nr:hypothetical protein [Amycolatopsis sp.]HET6707810.1 hypothetical protein [Amycolatopsis sp.]